MNDIIALLNVYLLIEKLGGTRITPAAGGIEIYPSTRACVDNGYIGINYRRLSPRVSFHVPLYSELERSFH